MITNCPTCGKEVDTIRARAVSVRDGKVVAFCSQECKAAAETQPVRAPVDRVASPAGGLDSAAPKKKIVDENSAPVIEITHEPASGVVTSAPDRREASSPAQTASSSAAGATTIPDAKAGLSNKSVEPAKDPKKDAKDAKDAKKAAKSGRTPDPDAAAGKGKSTDKPADNKTDAKPAAKAKPVDEIKSSGGKDSAATAGSIGGGSADDFTGEDEPKPADKKADKAADKKPKGPKAFDGKETPIAGFRLGDFQEHEAKDPDRKKAGGNGLAIAIIAILVVGGGGFLLYKFVLSTKGNAANLEKPAIDAASALVTPPVPVVTPDAAVALAKPAGIDPATALDKATALLRSQLTTVPRISTAAARILARTKDAEAIAVLVKQLPLQNNEAGKIDIAYALGRAGDKSGIEFLVGQTKVNDREHKLIAAERLALLHEQRGLDALANYVDYSQFQVQILRLLADAKDTKAIKKLEDVLANDKSKPDDKIAATIVLAAASRPDLAPQLRALLTDGRWNDKAALALARMKDLAARPTLVKQLEQFSLRVAAARGLRILEPKLDAQPMLAPLVATLASEKDTEQQTAAEAILLLVGAPELADYE